MDSKPITQSKSFWSNVLALQPAIIWALQVAGKAQFLPVVDPLFGVLSALGGLFGVYATATRSTTIKGII